MKLTRIMFGAALMLASSWCFAGATEDLLARSRALKTMSADFHEVITDEDGLELETYDGRIIIETAAKSFRLDTAEPEANAVVCNGKELYSYDPSVAQVTILSFDKIVQNSPFWLIIDPSPKVLEKFKITASGPDSFNIEARDIPAGEADVVVCDAFVGNVILKLYEGLASTLIHKIKDALMSTLRSKLGALMIKPALKGMLKEFDITSYGGAPMLGLRGLVVKTHGNSEAVEIRNAIEQCILFKKKDINGQFIEKMGLEQPKKADEKETASSEKDASGNTAASEN